MANNVQAETVVSAGTRFMSAEVTAYGDATTHIPGCFMAIVSGSEGAQTFAEVVGGAGAVSAGVQRMTLASDDPAVAALQIIDDAFKASASAVSKGVVIAGETAAGNAQTVTVRSAETISSDDDGLVTRSILYGVDTSNGNAPQAIGTDGAGSLQVALASGAAVSISGTVTVTGAGGTFPVTDSGGSLTIDNSTLAVVGGGTEAAAMRVTIASDSTGVLSIDDNGSSITVDGTFWQATQPVSIASLPALAAGTNNIGDVDILTIAAGDNNIGNVDIVTVPTDPFGANADAASATGSISAKLRFIAATGIPITGTVTVGSHAVTNAGTFVTQENGALLTAAQLIDNVIFVDDAAFTPATSSVSAVGYLCDETAPDSVDEGDVGIARMTADRSQYTVAVPLSGTVYENGIRLTVKRAKIDAATSGDNTLVTAVASKKIRVLSLFLMAAGTVTVRFEDGAAGTALTGQMELVAQTGFVLPYNEHGWFETSDNTLLNLELSGAISVDGCLTYCEAE